MRWILAPGLLLTQLLLACVSTTFEADPIPLRFRSADLRWYVQNHGADRRGIDAMIATELSSLLSVQAGHGDAASLPAGVDLLVTYEDRWQWDMANYLILLRIDVRDAATNALLAAGISYQTSLARKGPESVVEAILKAMLRTEGETPGR